MRGALGKGEHRISILHISDLHARSTDVSELPSATAKDQARREERREEVRNDARSRTEVVGTAWDANLRALFPDRAPDLVCFTGDVADYGLSAEYREAREFVERTLNVLTVDVSRLFVVPGNHDVQRSINEDEWTKLRKMMWSEFEAISRWLTPRGKHPRDVPADLADRVLERSRKFWRWVEHDLGRPELVPSNNAEHGKLGYCHRIELPGLPFPIHVIGLDSAWLSGDGNDQGKLWLTRHQRDRLLADASGKEREGLRIALMHHPPTELAQPEIGDTQRDLAQCVDLLLHGHVHDAAGNTLEDLDGRQLRVLAAGCLYEGSEGNRWPNCCHRIDITVNDAGRPRRAEIRFRSWSRRAGWHPDASLYRDQTADGRMLWAAWGSGSSASAPVELEPERPLVTTERFVGRTHELNALAEGLQESKAVAVTAVHGMPGVGKTFLTEHFAQQHSDDFPGGHHRIGLRPNETRTVDDLLGALAARLRVEPRELVAELAGRRALVIVDNVDSAALVRLVVQLWKRLPSIPLLVTGRYHELGREAGWSRVMLRPYEGYKLPLEQLAKEGVVLDPRQRDELHAMIDALGHLPLALSLAAGHLRTHAYTPRSFLDELKRRGLDIEPADPSDPRRFGDERARAVLRTSFELSWAHLRLGLEHEGYGAGEVDAMLRGLSCLAHGLMAPMGPSLAAATCGLPEDRARRVLAMATTLSLVQRVPGRVAWSLHPLIADFLSTSTPGVEPETVSARISQWFLDGLRRAEGQGHDRARVRDELIEDGESLALWLQGLSGREAYDAAAAGFDFAEDCGPYSVWIDVYHRAAMPSLAPEEESLRLWWLTTLAIRSGELEVGMRAATQKVELDEHRNHDLGVAFAKGKIADILQARGDLDRALETLEGDVLPAFERLGDVRSKAVTMGQIADILRVRGDLDRALEIRQNDELPVYERLGDVRSKAVTMGQIADILQARGDLDRALETLEGDLLPAFERLGDVRSKAVTMGKIADILQARGDLDRALEIRQQEQLPVYERLGAVRSKAVTQAKIAIGLVERDGEAAHAEALRLLSEAHAAFTRMQLPEAAQVESVAVSLGLSLDPSAEPTD